MNLVELPQKPFEGALNTSRFVIDPKGRILLQRTPKSNPYILKSIAHEYHFIGFTDLGGRFRKRTLQEQIGFAENAVSHGLRVLEPAFVDGSIPYYPLLNGAETLDDYLPSASDKDVSRVVYELFTDLKKAHKQNIVYGDRWSRNILIIPQLGVINIDFDIEIFGKPAKEFEVAQATYYTLCAGKCRVIPLLATILSQKDNWFNFYLFAGFLQGHAVHFRTNQRYGGMEKETDVVIKLIDQ